MAATGYTPISLYYSATASAVPLAANLVAGELALNTNDGKLYYKNSSNVVTQLAGAGGPAGGSSGQVQYNSSGVLAGSANLLFSGTDLTVYGLTVGRGAGAVAGNTAVGASALAANTSGAFNTSVGATTLAGNTTGVRNTGVGYAALFLGTTASYNSGFGFGTLNTNTGDNNTAIGYYSMGLNTSGASNSALGFQALYSNTTASNNTAVGYQAFYSNTTGGNQIGLGYQAGYNSAGSQNLAIGYQALYNNTGANIYAIGYQALYSNTGNDNYAFGFLSLNANTSGGNSVAMGLYTLRYNTTGSNHSAFGDRALTANTTGTFNSAFGSGTLSANTTGNYNVGLGMYALSSNTTASNSTGVGYQAGSLATGAGNQLFGYSSGSSITTGAKNVIIGSYTGSAAPISATGSNYIVLSDGDGNVRQTIDSSGNVGIGTTSPQSKLHVYTGASGVTPNSESKLTVESSGTAAIGILAPAASESIVYFGSPTSNVDGGIVYNHTSRNMIFRTAGNTNRMRMDSTGRLIIGADTANASESKLEVRGPANTGLSIYMLKAQQVEVNLGFGGGGDTNFYINSGSATIGTSGVYLNNAGNSWSSVSDERMKTIVEPIENASAKVATLRTVIGYFNNDTKQTRRPFLIAQDVQAVLPEAVNVQNPETGTLGMSYTDTIPLLVAAIKEQQVLITSLTARITALETI